MPNHLNNTRHAPNSFAIDVIQALRSEKFSVVPTTFGPKKGQRKTLRILWNGHYVGTMIAGLWTRQPPFACLYRFTKDGAQFTETNSNLVAHIPAAFNKEDFAKQHGCNPDMLRVSPEKKHSYLWVQDIETTLILMGNWAKVIDHASSSHPAEDEPGDKLEGDLKEILDDESKSPTERLAEISIRMGQGKFRADLEVEFAYACAATKLAVLPALRASHIVPWRISTDLERRDPKNGLLLAANIDALFDRYLITFEPTGVLKVSIMLTLHDLHDLGPIPNLPFKPCKRRASYLQRHNAEFMRLEQTRTAATTRDAESWKI